MHVCLHSVHGFISKAPTQQQLPSFVVPKICHALCHAAYSACNIGAAGPSPVYFGMRIPACSMGEQPVVMHCGRMILHAVATDFTQQPPCKHASTWQSRCCPPVALWMYARPAGMLLKPWEARRRTVLTGPLMYRPPVRTRSSAKAGM